MKYILIPVLAFFLSSPLLAKQHACERQPKGLKHLMQQLDLSEQQRQNIKALVGTARLDLAAFYADSRSLRAELRALIQANQWDETAVRNTLERELNVKQEKRLTHALTRQQIWIMLDLAQQQAFSELDLHEYRRGKRQLSCQQSHRMAHRLNLSESQQAEIADIRAEFAETRHNALPALAEYKTAESALIQQDNFAQDEWLLLYDQYEPLMIDMAVARAHMQHQLYHTLSDQQKTRYAQLKKSVSQTL